MKEDVVWIKDEPPSPRARFRDDEEVLDRATEIRIYAQAIRDLLSRQAESVDALEGLAKRRRRR